MEACTGNDSVIVNGIFKTDDPKAAEMELVKKSQEFFRSSLEDEDVMDVEYLPVTHKMVRKFRYLIGNAESVLVTFAVVHLN